MIEQLINWSTIQFNQNSLIVAATTKGLCYIGSPNQTVNQIRLLFPAATFVHNEAALQPYHHELSAYFSGSRPSFSFTTDIKGTAFQETVWTALTQIPYGETYTYTDIANLINRPTAVRAVATAIGANPILIAIPCHRVIGKNGHLTGYRGGMDMKRKLLALENSST